MFLVAVTRRDLRDCFRPDDDVELIRIGSWFATIVTDRFLTRRQTSDALFDVVESPLRDGPGDWDVVLSRVSYERSSSSLTVYKPVDSGRPIYYHVNENGEFYCSTHIELLRRAGVEIRADAGALPEFLVYRFVTPPATLYEGIFQLTLGGELSVTVGERACEIAMDRRYSPYDGARGDSAKTNSLAEAAKKVQASLSGAVGRLAPRRDALGIPLSGGLDSSILYALCNQQFGIRESYSTHYPFEDPRNDREKEYATSAAERFGSEHHFYESSLEEYLFGFLEAIQVAEEPMHHLQSVMLYLLFKNEMPSTTEVVVSGQGADGIFGLGLQYRAFHCERHPILLGIASRDPLRSWLKGATSRLKRGRGLAQLAEDFTRLGKAADDPDNIVYSLANYGSEQWICSRFGVSREQLIKSRYEAIKPFEGMSVYDVISMLDVIGDVSITQSIWAKLGEGSRRIVVYPFMDPGVMAAAYATDWQTKLAKPKNILLQVGASVGVPREIRERRKSGFGVMPQRWSGNKGAFAPLLPLAEKCFDRADLLQMQSFDYKCAMTFWNMLNYAIWKRLHIGGESLDALREELAISLANPRP